MNEPEQYPLANEPTRLIKEENLRINQSFNEKLYDLLVDADLSQRKLAKSMGIQDAGLISKTYTGKRSWSILAILHAGVCMGINVVELIVRHMNPRRKRLMLAKAVMVRHYFEKYEPELFSEVPQFQWISDLQNDDWPERE